jgi:hypothetical protein
MFSTICSPTWNLAHSSFVLVSVDIGIERFIPRLIMFFLRTFLRSINQLEHNSKKPSTLFFAELVVSQVPLLLSSRLLASLDLLPLPDLPVRSSDLLLQVAFKRAALAYSVRLASLCVCMVSLFEIALSFSVSLFGFLFLV